MAIYLAWMKLLQKVWGVATFWTHTVMWVSIYTSLILPISTQEWILT